MAQLMRWELVFNEQFHAESAALSVVFLGK
jgi:hypothetical protein